MQNRKGNRLRHYNYSQNGYYFITVCTYNREEWFGEIKNGEMVLNDFGEIAKDLWLAIPGHFINVKLDVFVIMLNHVHGIISIDNGGDGNIGDNKNVGDGKKSVDNKNVGDRHACPVQQQRRQYQVIPTIIGSYKAAVTRKINEVVSDNGFQWHRSFYDHVIRNERTLDSIREYITNNPLKWGLDVENKINVGQCSEDYYGKLFER